MTCVWQVIALVEIFHSNPMRCMNNQLQLIVKREKFSIHEFLRVKTSVMHRQGKTEFKKLAHMPSQKQF